MVIYQRADNNYYRQNMFASTRLVWIVLSFTCQPSEFFTLLLPVLRGFGQFSGTSTTTQIAASVLRRGAFSHRSTYTPNTLSNALLTTRGSTPVSFEISLDFKPSGCCFSNSRIVLWLLFNLHTPYIASKACGCVTKGVHLIKLTRHFF